ncbi:MAG: 2-phospho-L-lactate guanylyltransferase [Alphaproteobacteria bacterium]|nr:2-phospho-L-lactate guanylyltransferase [Alphaproteobacteria bacterium]
MTPVCVIPVRPFDEGKSRLAGVLSPAERRALCVRLFDHALDIAVAAFGADTCLVVSRSAEVRARAGARGVAGLAERGGDLNTALEEAADAVSPRAMLVLPADLPLAGVADLHALCAAGGLVVAPDVHGEGTNALLLPEGVRIRFAFGPGSRRAHVAAARAAGLTVTLLRREGLARDLDTPADLARLGLSGVLPLARRA